MHKLLKDLPLEEQKRWELDRDADHERAKQAHAKKGPEIGSAEDYAE